MAFGPTRFQMGIESFTRGMRKRVVVDHARMQVVTPSPRCVVVTRPMATTVICDEKRQRPSSCCGSVAAANRLGLESGRSCCGVLRRERGRLRSWMIHGFMDSCTTLRSQPWCPPSTAFNGFHPPSRPGLFRSFSLVSKKHKDPIVDVDDISIYIDKHTYISRLIGCRFANALKSHQSVPHRTM